MAVHLKLDNLTWHLPEKPHIWCAQTPLTNPSFLLDPANGCHVDHEGFDLNVIEQAYYKAQNIALSHDPTYYKDGDGVSGATAIIQPWCEQQLPSEITDGALVIDHSHFVYRYPINGPAKDQILQHTKQRPELARMLSAEFKCGLDLCIDAFYVDRVEPVVHIEWDFLSYEQLVKTSVAVQTTVNSIDWAYLVPTILNYNKVARTNRVDAFTQANTRSQLIFGQNSYILIPTL
jgi:hypothetical protein